MQADEEAAVTGKAADVIAAANTALEAAIRLIRPGKKISEVRQQVPIVMTPAGCMLRTAQEPEVAETD